LTSSVSPATTQELTLRDGGGGVECDGNTRRQFVAGFAAGQKEVCWAAVGASPRRTSQHSASVRERIGDSVNRAENISKPSLYQKVFSVLSRSLTESVFSSSFFFFLFFFFSFLLAGSLVLY
jgi:hypothetical protein